LAAGLDEDRVQGSSPPFFFGGLKSGSSAQEARAELSDIGIEVPEGYVAWPANNGRGWNFSPADDVGTERNLIRAMDSSNNPELYPYGDANVYDAAGNPVNALGLPPTSRADWHQPFKDFASNPAAGDELDGGGDWMTSISHLFIEGERLTALTLDSNVVIFFGIEREYKLRILEEKFEISLNDAEENLVVHFAAWSTPSDDVSGITELSSLINKVVVSAEISAVGMLSIIFEDHSTLRVKPGGIDEAYTLVGDGQILVCNANGTLA
jgi:Family of unknown function (DUF6188)